MRISIYYSGLPFSLSENYCCFDGIHDWSTGYCGPWTATASDPTCYDCSAGSRASFEELLETVRAKKLRATVAPIDTTVPNTVNPCYSATSSYGKTHNFMII